jgi:prepilin signal peptidase PulO-like enzyme (type II secretory pathway)
MSVLSFLAAGLGLLAGVLVNIFADDLPPNEHAQRGPVREPHCRVCGGAYGHWLALVGLVFQRGTCEHCGAWRGWRPVLVEVGLAFGFAYLWRWAEEDPGRFAAAAIITALFVLITVIDIEHRLILWRVVWVSALVLLGIGLVAPDRGWQKTLLGGVAGYGIVFVMFLVGQLYMLAVARFRGQPLNEIAFGGGDVNLAGLIGLAVGWSGVLFALFIGVVAAGVFSLAYVLVQLARRRYNPHTPIPYGPFLVTGAMVMYLYGQELAALWFGR